jgi:hypothetical protein
MLRPLQCSFSRTTTRRWRGRVCRPAGPVAHLLRLRGCDATGGTEGPFQVVPRLPFERWTDYHNMDGRKAHGRDTILAVHAYPPLALARQQKLQKHSRSRCPRRTLVWPRFGGSVHHNASDERLGHDSTQRLFLDTPIPGRVDSRMLQPHRTTRGNPGAVRGWPHSRGALIPRRSVALKCRCENSGAVKLQPREIMNTPKSFTEQDCRCANCGFTAEWKDLPPAREIEERHFIGDIFSDVECPECGALCFPVKTPEEEKAERVCAAAPDLLAALQQIASNGDIPPENLQDAQMLRYSRWAIEIAKAAIVKTS